MMEQLLLFALFLVSGYALPRFGLAKSQDYKALANFVFYVCLPASILASFSSVVLPQSIHLLLGILASTIAVSVLSSLALAKVLGLGDKAMYALVICAAFGNVIYLGFPFTEIVLGKGALPLAGVYASVYNVAVFAVILPLLTMRLGKASGAGVAKALANPAVLSTLLGLAVLAWDADISPVLPYLSGFAALTTPLSLLSMGLFISDKLSVRFDRTLLSIVLSKCAFFPLLTAALLLASGQWEAGRGVFLLSLMPVAISNFVIANSLGLGQDKAVMDSIIVSTLLSIAMVFGLAALGLF